MTTTAKSERKHIVFLGRRNAGKSSLVNAFADQEISIVSEVAGTTTDPVQKAMELLPFGPVVLVDTAGYDDAGELGAKRVEKTYKALSAADFVLLVVPADEALHEQDLSFIRFLQKEKLPHTVVISKCDLAFANSTSGNESPVSAALKISLAEAGEAPRQASVHYPDTIPALRDYVAATLPRETEPPLINDLIRQGDIVLLVTPIDLGAPKGRLIMPQVQTIRESLDSSAITIIVKDKELRAALESLNRQPALVVCDSQAIMRVAADTPPNIRLTTFSILMARHKGDLKIFAKGLRAVDALENNDTVLIAESCSHHAQEDDIGKVKIPRWLRNYSKKNIQFEFSQGIDFPEDIQKYKLIVHCGGCMLTRKAMLSRLKQADYAGVPIINYGMIISLMHGAIPRAIELFPEATAEYSPIPR